MLWEDHGLVGARSLPPAHPASRRSTRIGPSLTAHFRAAKATAASITAIAQCILPGMAELPHRTDASEGDIRQPSLPFEPLPQDANGSPGFWKGRKHRALDLILLLVALVGGFLALQNGRQLRQVRAEYERLSKITGDLPISDASKVHVRALETGERLHFAWRVYLPLNYRAILRHNSGSSSSWRSDPYQFIARVRFREDEQGRLQAYTCFSGSSSCMGLGDSMLAKVLHDNWDKIRVEQLGAPGLALIAPDQSAVLLRLTLPDELQQVAREKLPPWMQNHFVPTLFELHLGPEATKP